jgi:hypothetical protein
MDLSPTSGEGRETPTVLGPSRLALSKGPNTVGVFLHSPEVEDRSDSGTLCCLVIWNPGRWIKSRNTVSLSATQHRQ